jgi:Rne/Rng family ribonuclease
MAKEICISSTPHETRLAILEDDQLAEIYYERENEYTLAGSIYNGRVTRVLPGMQSAFVDVGLERDAFLYVTDFMELEDPEETDELEKAAASGGNQAPREVRQTQVAEGNGGRSGARPPRPGQKSDPKPDQKQESRPERTTPDRQSKGQRLSVEAIPDAADAVPQSSFVSESADDAQDDSGEPGAKRWRGRRRRRGGRGGAAGSQENQTEAAGSEPAETYTETSAEGEVAPVIHAAAGHQGDRSSPRGRGAAPAPHGDRTSIPEPFVLPGESLSKYGGVSEDEAPKSDSTASQAPPARPSSAFKPATLIEAPLAWDGSGLLPGESLSKHRTHQVESSTEAETQTVQADAIPDSGDAPDLFEEEELVSERTDAYLPLATVQAIEATPEAVVPESEDDLLVEEESSQPEPFEDDQLEESTEPAPEPRAAKTKKFEVEEVIEEYSADEPMGAAVTPRGETAAVLAPETSLAAERADAAATLVEPSVEEPAAPTNETAEPEADRAASHHIDPLPPSTFRIFGLGGKKKTEELAPDDAAPPVETASVSSVSAYAPGSGVLEEELIEEEEFDAPHHHGKAEEHDLEDYEEETLPAQMRTGDLGEMLQEAHLDHKIQLNFDGKSGEEDDDEEDDEEDEASAEGQPSAAGEGQGHAQQPRDRGGRGRRGRGPQGSQGSQGNRRGGGPSRRSMQTSDLPIISDLLKPGQEILVQIAKEPIAKKGARITSHIALPGRFLVFMPTVSHIGVSRKIDSDEERQRLKRILVHERGEASGGFIVRTAAEGASEEDLRADLRFLIHLWDEIKTRSDTSKSPALIYHDLSLIERILRDQVSSNFSAIWVDSEADYERIVRFLNRFSPTLVRRVKLYTKEVPLFEHFGIQDEISKALRSKVWLKSGGSIVINQTEALVAIDINTGKYVGKSARLEDTIVKTNMDAVPEIVRQIRLRDLGGIIVIDFIDMDERKNRFKVLAALEEALKSDRAPTKVLQFNDFGLVAITRKRVKQSLERTLSVPCPTCQATGMVKSPTTVCNEIYTELRKMKKHFEGADVLLRVNPETVKVLKANNGSWLTEFEELVSKNILVKSDATLHPEQFDIQG